MFIYFCNIYFVGSHGEVDRMLMNKSLGPKSNLSKSSNINVDNFKVSIYFDLIKF